MTPCGEYIASNTPTEYLNKVKMLKIRHKIRKYCEFCVFTLVCCYGKIALVLWDLFPIFILWRREL